jgi:DNA-directed RNA polymerase specialized sigma24 family protein
VATRSGAMLEVGSDGGLALGALAGDRTAFAQLYDRFATPVHDLQLALTRDPGRAEEATFRTFERAVAELDHLGDPSRLRPWLYAIAYRVGRARPRRRRGPTRAGTSRARPSRAGTPRFRTEPTTQDDPQARLWQLAPSGLTGLDRALVTLCLRHGLDYAEVGRIVGLSRGRVQSRMTGVRPWCDLALRGLLSTERRDTTVDPAEDDTAPLRTAVPLVPPPYRLRDRVLREVRLMSAHEGLPRPRGRMAWIATGLAALLVVSGTGLLVRHNLTRPAPVAVSFGPASELTLSTTVLDLGTDGTTATVTLSNTGARLLEWRAATADPWLGVTPAAGSLAGGSAQTLTITIARDSLAEGDAHSRLTVSGAGDQGEVAVALRQERPPTIVSARASAGTIGGYGCPGASDITAVVRDETGPVQVMLVGPGRQSQVMQGNGEVYTGRLGSGGAAGIPWRVVATDGRNNTSTSATQLIVHGDCAVRPPPPKPVVRAPVVRAPAARSGGSATARPGSGAAGTGGAGSGTAGSGADTPGPTAGAEGDEDGSGDDSGSGTTDDGGTGSGGSGAAGGGTSVDSSGNAQNFTR